MVCFFFFPTKSLKLTHFYTCSTLQFGLATFPMLHNHTGQCKTRPLPKLAFRSTPETVQIEDLGSVQSIWEGQTCVIPREFSRLSVEFHVVLLKGLLVCSRHSFWAKLLIFIFPRTPIFKTHVHRSTELRNIHIYIIL